MMFDKIMDLLGSGGAAVAVIGAASPGAIPAWLMIAGTAIAMVTGRAANKGIPIYSSMKNVGKDARGQIADAEQPK
jgi:hypothetical protein